MRILLTALSNPLTETAVKQTGDLVTILRTHNHDVTLTDLDRRGTNGSAADRARILTTGLADYDVVIDVSGGNRSSEILHYLPDDLPEGGHFIGYSDLSAVHGFLQSRGRASTLFQPRHLATDNTRLAEFLGWLHGNAELVTFPTTPLRGTHCEGVLVGGNLRTLLKLAGTPYFPPMQDSVLLLEGRTSDTDTLIPQLAQLAQIGVLKQISGLVIGTFTTFEENHDLDDLVTLVAEFLPANLPWFRTSTIGHAKDAKAGALGTRYTIDSVAKPVGYAPRHS